METGVIWLGRFVGSNGYAFATRSYVDALKSQGFEVIMVDSSLRKVVGQYNGMVSVSASGAKLEIKAKDPERNFVAIYNEAPLQYNLLSVSGRTRRIGLAFSETADVPYEWHAPMLDLDELWTASEFNRQAFIRAGIPDYMVKVLPIGLDMRLYNPDLAGHSIYYDCNKFTFLMVISNFNRKDTQNVIRAYCQAFQGVKDTQLILKVPKLPKQDMYDRFINGPLNECAAHFGLLPEITVTSENYTDEYMISLYNSADCYLAIERAKGWDIPAFQSMALGKLVLGLNWSANTEFMNDRNSLLLEPHEALIYADRELMQNLDLYTGHKWASYNYDLLVEAMRDVYNNRTRYTERGLIARADLRANYDLPAIGRRFRDLIEPYQGYDFASNHPAVIILSKTPAGSPRPASSPSIELLHQIDGVFKTPAFPLDRKIAAYVKTKSQLHADPTAKYLTKKIRRLFSSEPKKLGLPLFLDYCKARLSFHKNYKSMLALGRKREIAFDPMKQSLDDWVALQKTAEGIFGPKKNSPEENERLAKIKGQYRGKRIFILGNGPSLNKIDFNKLKDEYTFACNKIYLKYDTSPWRPTFYTALDWRVTPDSHEEINTLTGDSIRFFPTRFKGLLHDNDQTYWYTTIPATNHCEDNFSLDIRRGVVGWGTVVYSAAQIACHLGFSQIYFLGVDVSYQILDTVKQSGADRFKTGVKLELESTQDDDPNHFDPRYFGKGAKWHDPNVDHMIRGFWQMKKCLAGSGIQVYNATVGGRLEDFERVDFDSLFIK